MQKAIGVVGPPLSGKTSLVSAYEPNVLSLDGVIAYLKNIPPSGEDACAWVENGGVGLAKRCPAALAGYLSDKLSPYVVGTSHTADAGKPSVLLLDGFPHNTQEASIVRQHLDLVGFIEVHIDMQTWIRRAKAAAMQQMEFRETYFYHLAACKEQYETHIRCLMDYASCQWVQVPNAQDLRAAQPWIAIAIRAIAGAS